MLDRRAAAFVLEREFRLDNGRRARGADQEVARARRCLLRKSATSLGQPLEAALAPKIVDAAFERGGIGLGSRQKPTKRDIELRSRPKNLTTHQHRRLVYEMSTRPHRVICQLRAEARRILDV
jgi:hypothetical protein